MNINNYLADSSRLTPCGLLVDTAYIQLGRPEFFDRETRRLCRSELDYFWCAHRKMSNAYLKQQFRTIISSWINR